MNVMEKIDEIKDVKGKEFVAAKVLFLIAIILFSVPIALVLLLKFLFTVTQRAKVQIDNSITLESHLEKIYSKY